MEGNSSNGQRADNSGANSSKRDDDLNFESILAAARHGEPSLSPSSIMKRVVTEINRKIDTMKQLRDEEIERAKKQLKCMMDIEAMFASKLQLLKNEVEVMERALKTRKIRLIHEIDRSVKDMCSND